MQKRKIVRRKLIRKEMRISARVQTEFFDAVKKYADAHHTKVSQVIIDTLIEKLEIKLSNKIPS